MREPVGVEAVAVEIALSAVVLEVEKNFLVLINAGNDLGSFEFEELKTFDFVEAEIAEARQRLAAGDALVELAGTRLDCIVAADFLAEFEILRTDSPEFD